MDGQFQSAQAGYAAYEAVAGFDRAAVEGWGFAGDIQRRMGEDFEPDARFLEESWTLGVEAAAENLRLRRDGQADRQRKSNAFREMDNVGTMAWVEASEWYAGLRSATGAIAGRFDVRWLQQEPVDPPRGLPDELIDIDENGMTLRRASRLLGVAATSTRQQIKAAYRKLAIECHPDRLAASTENACAYAGERMAEINEAYRLLRTMAQE